MENKVAPQQKLSPQMNKLIQESINSTVLDKTEIDKDTVAVLTKKQFAGLFYNFKHPITKSWITGKGVNEAPVAVLATVKENQILFQTQEGGLDPVDVFKKAIETYMQEEQITDINQAPSFKAVYNFETADMVLIPNINSITKKQRKELFLRKLLQPTKTIAEYKINDIYKAIQEEGEGSYNLVNRLYGKDFAQHALRYFIPLWVEVKSQDMFREEKEDVINSIQNALQHNEKISKVKINEFPNIRSMASNNLAQVRYKSVGPNDNTTLNKDIIHWCMIPYTILQEIGITSITQLINRYVPNNIK